MSSHPGESSLFNTEAAVKAMPPYNTCSKVVSWDDGGGAAVAAFLDAESCTNSLAFLSVGGDR